MGINKEERNEIRTMGEQGVLSRMLGETRRRKGIWKRKINQEIKK